MSITWERTASRQETGLLIPSVSTYRRPFQQKFTSIHDSDQFKTAWTNFISDPQLKPQLLQQTLEPALGGMQALGESGWEGSEHYGLLATFD